MSETVEYTAPTSIEFSPYIQNMIKEPNSITTWTNMIIFIIYKLNIQY